jgi:hypothetical protein
VENQLKLSSSASEAQVRDGIMGSTLASTSSVSMRATPQPPPPPPPVDHLPHPAQVNPVLPHPRVSTPDAIHMEADRSDGRRL